ncbi:MAG TPA: bifunctional DNA-formamidopyrimidine glycosylase/DNA-(apurinic or apyrimidinic site) lyase [Bryobacteraceae bacterium]|nr:bifunctional DNA-formamidopyrimidine glycosylase/DNA-(apurinic or apyrimidinic site) lyase [Bryobacteraceae bacterium]
MPELPEVEAVVRRLRPLVEGARIVSCGQWRATTAKGTDCAVGRRIEGVDRRGKHILVRLESGAFLRVHLKMTGNLTVVGDARMRPPTVRAWFEFDDGRAMALDDPRALGRVTFHERGEENELFRDLGPEPFSGEFTVDHLKNKARGVRKPVKTFLMDQRAVTGLGNIYAAEALFEAGIDPRRAAGRISTARIGRLHAAIVGVLRVALDSALRAYIEPGGFTEGENFPVAVYGRQGEPCPACGKQVKRIIQGGRSTYFCSNCQR